MQHTALFTPATNQLQSVGLLPQSLGQSFQLNWDIFITRGNATLAVFWTIFCHGQVAI